MDKDKQIIMYKKECCNEPYCSFNQVLEQLDQLKAENERLKQAFAESDNDCFRLEKENRLLKVYRSIAPFKVKKLVQTLEEIKEEIDYVNNHPCGEGTRAVALHNILNKINEVDDESYLNNHWLFTKEKGED